MTFTLVWPTKRGRPEAAGDAFFGQNVKTVVGQLVTNFETQVASDKKSTHFVRAEDAAASADDETSKLERYRLTGFGK